MLKYSLQSGRLLSPPAMLSESKTALSRVIDGTGRAVRTQSCPFDSEALKTLTAPCAAVHKLS